VDPRIEYADLEGRSSGSWKIVSVVTAVACTKRMRAVCGVAGRCSDARRDRGKRLVDLNFLRDSVWNER